MKWIRRIVRAVRSAFLSEIERRGEINTLLLGRLNADVAHRVHPRKNSAGSARGSKTA